MRAEKSGWVTACLALAHCGSDPEPDCHFPPCQRDGGRVLRPCPTPTGPPVPPQPFSSQPSSSRLSPPPQSFAPPPSPPVADEDLGSALGPNVAGGFASAYSRIRGSCDTGIGERTGERILAWTAPMEGWYVADMQGSALVDTVLYVLNDLGQEIVCNDDISLDRASRVMFRAAAGQRFFLVADGYSRIQVHIAHEPPGDPPQVQLNLGRMPSECPDFELTPGRPFSRTQPFVSGGTMQHRPSRLEGTCGGAPQAEVTWSFTPHTTGFWRFLATGGAVQVLRGRCSNTPMTDCGMIEPVWLEQGQEVTVVMRGRSPDQAISFSLDVEGPAVCGDHQCTEWAGESLSTCCQDCR